MLNQARYFLPGMTSDNCQKITSWNFNIYTQPQRCYPLRSGTPISGLIGLTFLDKSGAIPRSGEGQRLLVN